MSTMVVTTKITTKYLMNKTKYDLSQMVLDTLDESDELRAEVATLRAALECIEWTSLTVYGPACPWCGGYMKDGHKPDCLRQLALAMPPHDIGERTLNQELRELADDDCPGA